MRMRDFFEKLKEHILFQIYKIPEYNNRGDDSLFGKYRVKYSDGQMSQRMCYESAKTYSQIFGGSIELDLRRKT